MTHEFENPLRPIGDTTLTFNGTSDYHSIDNDPAFNYPRTQDFTVAAWIRAETNQATLTHADNDIIEKWSGTGTAGGYPFVVRFLNETAGQHAGKVTAARWDRQDSAGVRSTSRIDDGAYHHVAFVRRTLDGQGHLYLYVDGVLESSRSDITTGETTNDSALVHARPGGSTAQSFSGSVRGLNLYSVGLDEGQIQQLTARVTLYQNVFSGAETHVGLECATGLGGVSSISVPAGMFARLTRVVNPETGELQTISVPPGQWSFVPGNGTPPPGVHPNPWNDAIIDVVVTREPTVILYQNVFGGAQTNVGWGGAKNLGGVSSISVPAGMIARLTRTVDAQTGEKQTISVIPGRWSFVPGNGSPPPGVHPNPWNDAIMDVALI